MQKNKVKKIKKEKKMKKKKNTIDYCCNRQWFWCGETTFRVLYD